MDTICYATGAYTGVFLLFRWQGNYSLRKKLTHRRYISLLSCFILVCFLGCSFVQVFDFFKCFSFFNFGVSCIWLESEPVSMEHVTSWLHHGWDLAPLVTASCLIYLKEMPYPGHLVSSQSKQLPWPPSWQTPRVRGRIWHRLEVLGVGGHLASRMSRMLDDPMILWFFDEPVFTFSEECWMHNQFWSQSLLDGPLSHLWLTWWWIFGCRVTAGKEMPPLLPLFEEVLEISCWARNSWQPDTLDEKQSH